MTELTHLIVLDFEATCDDQNPPVPQEVIEFPSVLLSMPDLRVVDEFEAFVRPVHHPRLTDFCRELTGIEQSDVDRARPFPEVLDAHLQWLQSHDLPVEGHASSLPYAFITCGDWDFQTLFPAQLRASNFDHVPVPYRQWINLKVPFAKWSGKPSGGMARMLKTLNIKLEGRHHRGIDDARNIAKIARALVQHQTLRVTSVLPASRYPPVTITLHRDGDSKELTLSKRVLNTLLGAASGAFRRQATKAFLIEGDVPLDDEALLDLRSGAAVRVE